MSNVVLFHILVLLSSMMYCCGSSTILTLEKISSSSESFSELKAKDRVRHHRMFQASSSSSSNGIINLPLQGSADAYTLGRYFTRVKIGSPPQEYYLIIDTASQITWVNCISCSCCPTTSGLIEMSFFDPSNSSSAALVSCSEPTCKSVAQADRCSSKSLCSYSIPYADGNSVSGYYVSDIFHFDTIMGNSKTAIPSVDIVFGCTNNESGSLTDQGTALNGVFGLGHQSVSVISQLASRGIAPNVFSHCLKGDAKGGGILVLGEVVEPGMVYTPLVPSESQYSLNLLSISISGKTVPIDPKVFSTSRNLGGTIVDSGTTYSYLSAEAYDPFVTALSAAVPPSVSSYIEVRTQCFQVSSTIDAFPQVSLNFAGGASMVLKPREYLIQKLEAGPGVWCVGFQKSAFQNNQGLTILGDLVLKDKVIVYDLAHQRLGWAEYDCSASVNVSLVPPKVSSSSREAVLYHQLIPIATGGFIVYISIFAGILYL